MRPFIGVTCSSDSDGQAVVRPRYVRAVQDAGGLPVPLPFVGQQDPQGQASAWLGRLDGMLFTGSEDLHPSLWGGVEHPALELMHPARQATEVALARAALEGELALLAICGGMQTLNQVAGGTLHLHLPDLDGTHLDHQDPTLTRRHRVAAEPDSQLARCLGTAFDVNTAHHQAVDAPGAGMLIAARSEDGLAEAWEMPGRAFALGVQWHPERMGSDGGQRRLFEAFVEAARGVPVGR